MTKIDVISGFLGAGKTTLIKKLLGEALQNEKIVLIENEFGEIGIDGGFLKDSGITVNEMNSGCICCSLVGDFGKALHEVMETYHPDRILIEPSGVGKLSDVLKAVKNAMAEEPEMELGHAITVADGTKCKIYRKNFGEFYKDQVANAHTIVLSRTQKMSEEKLTAAVELLREDNPEAAIITTPWDILSADQILTAMDGKHSLEAALLEEVHHHHDHHHEECGCGHHHDHDHHHHEECGCGHHHHHDHHHEECGCGHHHDHDHHHEECGCGHHHDHDHHHEECGCGHHHDHGHHHADEVFTSWGVETPKTFTKERLTEMLSALDSISYGIVLRAKGIVPAENGTWLHFDFVPDELEIREGEADYTGRLCVIGSDLKTDALKALFEV